MTNFQRLSAGASLAILALAATTAAYAQETTSAVHGVVTSGGRPVTGASVQFVHIPSGARLTTSTERTGVFDARGLRIGGPYTMTVTSAGAPARVLNDIFLTVGKTSDIDVDLSGSNEVEEVVVTAAGIKNSDQGPKTVLNRLDIQQVVSVNRDPRDLARRDMMVAADLNASSRLGVNGGGVSIAGSNPRYNRIAVDGVSAQDNFGLNQGGLTTARGPVNLDAIEQFAVAAVPTDVENGDFVGGALNLALRSGTNTVHGAAFYNYLNDGLVGHKTESVRIKQAVTQKNYGLFLSGPIWQDHLFFAVSYEDYATVDATQYNVQGSSAPNKFINNGSQATIDSVVNAFNNNYLSNFPTLGIADIQPVSDRKYSAKIDWNIMEGQRASFTYRYAESSNIFHPNGSSVTTAQLDSQNYTKFDSDEAFTGELHSTWNDRFSTFFKVTKRTFIDTQTPPSGQNFSDVRVCTAPSAGGSLTLCESPFIQVNFGPDIFRHANTLGEKELRFQFSGEYSMGDHLLKFGGQARRATPKDLFVSSSRGQYYFDSLADFAAGNASQLSYQNSITGNPIDTQFKTTYWTYSAFAQDTINITDDLKVAVGLRYDLYHYPDSPLFNPNFLARNGYANTKTIDKLDVVMPRVSINWQATPDLKFAAGGGLFSGGTPDVLTGAPFYNTGYNQTQIDIRRAANGTFSDFNNTPGFTQAIGASALNGLTLDPTFGYAIPANVRALQQGTLSGTPLINPLGAVIALTPSYQMPAQWKLFLSGQWDTIYDVHLTADVVATKVQSDITYYDARATPLIVNGAQQFLPDGRIRYDGLAANATGKNSVSIPGSNNDLIVGNTSKGHGYTVAFSASKSWDWGGDVSIGYARQRLRDVSAGLFFGTTAGSFYGSVPANNDPNRDTLGRSVYEIGNRYKAEFGFHRNFFGDNETRFNLFAERQSGRPYGFIMTDAVSGRGPVFGVTKTAQALYVPDFAADANPNDLRVGFVTFQDQTQLNNFRRYATNFKLPAGVVKKYSNTNPDLTRLDLSISQQLPTLVEGHKIRIQADLRNVLNFLNHKWGRVAEYSDTTRLATVACTDAAGAAVTTANPVCAGYRYSNVPTSVPKNVNSQLSLWYMQLSFRYEF